MRAIAEAHTKRSLRLFQDTIHKYKSEVDGDPIIQRHLNELYDNLLELNLNKIIEPFSCVEIAHVAGLIELGVPVVEKKLSQMILDKKLAGILDQGNGCLIVFDDLPHDVRTALYSLSRANNCLIRKFTRPVSTRSTTSAASWTVCTARPASSRNAVRYDSSAM
jgi:hypothetical protein